MTKYSYKCVTRYENRTRHCCCITNLTRINFVKDGIAPRFCLPSRSNNLLWHVLIGGLTPPPNLPFPWGGGPLCNTVCHLTGHKCTWQMTSKSVEPFKQEARM